jgi:hypothetical protein
LPRKAIDIPQENPPDGRLKRLYMQRNICANDGSEVEKELEGDSCPKGVIHLRKEKKPCEGLDTALLPFLK